MAVKLVISRVDDPQWQHEREFDQDVITIGRDRANALLLDDPKKIISRRHAQIKIDNGQYYLIDSGSQNFTHLNGKRISRNIPHRLRDNDNFQIGNYKLSFLQVEAAPSKDATVFMVNPFLEEMKILTGLLNKINRKYEQLDHETREMNFMQAFKDALSATKSGDVKKLMSSQLSGQQEMAPEAAREQDTQSATKSLRLNQTLALLASAVTDITGATRKFQNQFVKVKDRSEEQTVDSMTADDLKSFLLSSDISEAEMERRRKLITQQIDGLLEQQRAISDVYQVKVNDGMRQILTTLNPDKLTQEYADQGVNVGPIKIPGRLIPFYVETKVNQSIRKKLRGLISEKRSLVERYLFKPLFEHAFQKRQAGRFTKVS